MEQKILANPPDVATMVSAPVPIVALDFPTSAQALELVERLPAADFFKVGLQLFSATGPEFVRALKKRGYRVFLDLKLHDIPNTVAGAVRAVAQLEVDLLTVHAAGGAAMLHAAVDAAASAAHPPDIFAVTVLTSLSADDLAVALGRSTIDPRAEVVRFAELAHSVGTSGVVASVHEVEALRSRTGAAFQVLTPAIRLPGDRAGDQARIATPADAARVGADYIVLGRSITAAPDPAAAYERVLSDLKSPPEGS